MERHCAAPASGAAALRYGDPAAAADAAAELESLGYSALWVPDVGGDVFGAVENLLGATTTDDHRHRHPQPLDALAGGDRRAHAGLTGRARRPLPRRHRRQPRPAHRPCRRPGATDARWQQMVAYLDALDAADPPSGPNDRVLAALGPKMLELARDRTAGVHPYLVTPEHTATARGGARRRRRWSRRSRPSCWRPTRPRPATIARLHLRRLPRPAELRQQLAAPRLHRGRHRRRRQRPPGRRARRVGRRGHASPRACRSTATPAPTTCACR